MSPDHATTPRPTNDLPWLALRYVMGELAEADSAAFERRLDDDQEAREAVAEAVALALATSTAAARDQARRPREERRAMARFALAAAAAWILWAAPWRVLNREAATVTQAPGPALEGKAVALAWSGLRLEGAESAPLDMLASVEEPLAVEPAPGEADALPVWLIEAAALPGLESGEEDQGS